MWSNSKIRGCRNGSLSKFLNDTKGAVTTEFTVLVPFFVFLLVFFADASVIYLTHTEMYNASRDIARRMATGQLKTSNDVQAYAEDHLHLGSRTYVVDPQFGNAMTVTISVGLDEAVFFGTFFQPILGRSLLASSTVQREPRLTPS